MMRLRCAMLLSAAIFCSCRSGDGGELVRAPGSDARLPLVLTDIPAGCPPKQGNDRGIGEVCTRNGRECKNGMSCLCDDRLGFAMPENMPCFCTNPALGTCEATTPECGTKAICCEFSLSAAAVISGCFPNVCLPQGKCPILVPLDAGTAASRDAAKPRD